MTPVVALLIINHDSKLCQNCGLDMPENVMAGCVHAHWALAAVKLMGLGAVANGKG